jgi:hypothetical protein
MTREERERVQAAARRYCDAVAELVKTHAEPVPGRQEDRTDDRARIAFIVNRLDEEVSGPIQQLFTDLQNALGEERGTLFFLKTEPWFSRRTFDDQASQGGSRYRVTLESRRNSDGTVSNWLYRGKADSEEGYFLGTGFTYPLGSDSVMAPYVGLFGTEPLLEEGIAKAGVPAHSEK